MTFQTQLATAFTPISATYDDTSITQALAWSQTFIEEFTNRGPNGFDLISGDVAFVTPRQRRALLPAIPVVSVSEVQALLPTAGGMTWQTLTNYAFTADTGLIYDTSGQPGVPAGLPWPSLPASLQVTYDHGYSTVPGALINAACRFAQQYLENPTLKLQRGVGQLNDRFAGNTGGVGIVINDFDQRILGRYTLAGMA